MDSKSFVLDSSAFYYGFHLSNSKKYYVTKLIIHEVRHLLSSYSIYDTLIDLGLLTTIEPSLQYISHVKNIAFKSGDINRLTKADISIISLAYQLGYPLISDDYSVQNVSKILNIKIFSLGTSEISNIRIWTNLCKTCNKFYPPNISECKICGNKTRRKYKLK